MIKLTEMIPMKFTKAQVNKLNKRLKEKKWHVFVFLKTDKTLKVQYKSIDPNDEERYYWDLLHSIIVNNNRFDDIYYSIV